MTLVQMHPIMGVGEEIFLYAVPKHLGYFAAEGLDVGIQNTQTGMVSAQLLQSGNAQVGTTAGDAMLGARARRRSGLLLQSQAQSWHLPGRAARIADPEACGSEGQDIGAPSFGAGGGLELKENLAEMGIKPEQYTAISTGAGPAAIAALRSGKIDALVVWDAMLADAEKPD